MLKRTVLLVLCSVVVEVLADKQEDGNTIKIEYTHVHYCWSCPSATESQEITSGAPTEEDPSDPKYAEIAKKAWRKYVKDNDITDVAKTIKVTRVTEQLVKGSITRVFFKVTTKKSSTLKCKAELYEITWEDFSELTVDCHPE